eukprot:GDKH01012647.1.p1 GENE.GDKH01012647.1~~GDKH01012647.1.p1  ORF type:complete len:50 (-),score=6.36 GDKH01012647.1:254-382(-)
MITKRQCQFVTEDKLISHPYRILEMHTASTASPATENGGAKL